MIESMPVWCCEHKSKCKWQGFALHQGLAWGEVPKGTEWRKWHDQQCGGGLIQGYVLASSTERKTAGDPLPMQGVDMEPKAVDPDSEKGIHRKYEVRRTDGSSDPGRKHHTCTYFVLDLKHDRYSIPALRAYAEACKDAYPALAKDLLGVVNNVPTSVRRYDDGESVPTPDGEMDRKLLLDDLRPGAGSGGVPNLEGAGTNYVADHESQPRQFKFANGRRVWVTSEGFLDTDFGPLAPAPTRSAAPTEGADHDRV